MIVSSFLKSLPAILGLVGFFAYLWVGQYKIGGDLMKSIIAKLRTVPNLDIENYKSLTPSKLRDTIEKDASIRRAVNKEDIKIIGLIVILHNIVTIIVLMVCGVLVGVSIWLIVQPEPLSITPHKLENINPKQSGYNMQLSNPIVVDIYPVKVSWDASGKNEYVSVSLEDVDGSNRTMKKTVLSDALSVDFSTDELRKVLSNRDYHGKNRVRSVIEWSGHTKRSEILDVYVGITITLMIGGKLITPKETRNINTLYATIDDSTVTMPRNYCYSIDFVGKSKSTPFVSILKACNDNAEVNLEFLKYVDLSFKPGLILNKPDEDRNITKLCISGLGSYQYYC